MRRFTLTMAAALAMVIGISGFASASDLGSAVITSDLTGVKWVYPNPPSTVTGDVSISVDQAVRFAGMTVTKMEFKLAKKVRFTSIASITLAGDDGDSCSGAPVIGYYIGKEELKVSSMACADTDADGFVEFTLSLTDVVGSSTVGYPGTYALKVEYKSSSYWNGTRWRSYEWENRTLAGVVITAA